MDGQRVIGHYVIGGVGMMASATIPIEVGFWNLEDYTSTPDPANLAGPFGISGCSATIGIGFSFAQVFQGKGEGPWSFAPSFGLGGGCFALWGYSKLVNTVSGCCAEGPNPVIMSR